MSSSGATRQMLGIGDTSGRRETLEARGFYQMGCGRGEGERGSGEAPLLRRASRRQARRRSLPAFRAESARVREKGGRGTGTGRESCGSHAAVVRHCTGIAAGRSQHTSALVARQPACSAACQWARPARADAAAATLPQALAAATQSGSDSQGTSGRAQCWEAADVPFKLRSGASEGRRPPKNRLRAPHAERQGPCPLEALEATEAYAAHRTRTGE